jgi:hypothetical protein
MMHSKSLHGFLGFKVLAALLLLGPAGCGAADVSADGDDGQGSSPGAVESTIPSRFTARIMGSQPPEAAIPTMGGEDLGTAQEAVSTGHGISYNGGPVMAAGANVYLIWYGNWANNSATTIIPDWASHIGGSPYFNINTSYSDSSNAAVENVVTYKGAATDSYSHGSALQGSDIGAIVSGAIGAGKLPLDTNGVYFVLTSTDVTNAGFCTSFCGYHTYETINGINIKFSFVGNAQQCNGSCGGLGTTPNGNAGADDMISVMTHELEETVTDPLLNAWTDSNGENADKCAWNFGSQYTTSNGGKANVKLGSRDYLIQQNWLNTGAGSCQMSYAPCGVLGVQQSLFAGQSVNSCDGRFTLTMQADQNLVLYWNGHGALWASNTWNSGATRATMQSDGNFVVYNANNNPLWASGTSGHPGSTLAVQPDGNAVIYDKGTARWASNTCCH